MRDDVLREPTGSDLMKRAEKLHDERLVVDCHVDTLLDIRAGKRRITETDKGGHVNLPRLQAGGVDLQVFAVWVPPDVRPGGRTLRALEMVEAFWREVESNPDALRPVTSRNDLRGSTGDRRIAGMLSIEGGEPLEGSLAALGAFYRLGVRAMGLTWNNRNELADGAMEWETNGGLTRFGREVVSEMNRLGMVIDVSHLPPAGFWDVIECSDAPVIASHSNARTLCDHPRNLTDDQIRALAEKGGVIGMNFLPTFLTPDPEGKPATVDDVVQHVEHIVELVGPNHIGLGTDFDGIDTTPVGLEDPSKLPALTARLLERGYSEDDLAKLLGENFLGVFARVLH